MKAYTDLQQSEKLAKILPLESADMYWESNLDPTDREYLINKLKEKESFNVELNEKHYSIGKYDIPCWSLAALIELLPPIDKLKPMIDLEGNYVYYSGHEMPCTIGETLVDACVDMIFKLKERKLI